MNDENFCHQTDKLNDSVRELNDTVTSLVGVLTEIKDWLLTRKVPESEPAPPVPATPAWNSFEERDQADAKVKPFKCPLCNGPMKARMARATGEWFAGCAKFPECTGTRNLDGTDSTRRKATVAEPPEEDDVPF